MTTFAVLIVALALASGLQAATVQIKPSSNSFTYFVGNGQYQQMPGGIEFIPEPVSDIEFVPEPASDIEFVPEPVSDIEYLPEPSIPEYQPGDVEYHPEPVEEVPQVKPLPIVNPCEACFSYMTSLIEELTDTVAVEAHIPDGPHQIDPETELRPLPVEEVPETKPVVPSISYFPYFPAVAN